MRILMVSQFWTPEPFLKALPFARELVARGHQVEVLTGYPNYPGGSIYEGYRRKLWTRESIEGITVNRVWLYPSHDGSGRHRMLNYLSYAATALVLGPWITRRPDVIYVYHPPATAALPAKWISLLKRAPVVYDIQDLWPDSVLGTGMMPRRLTKVLERFCGWVHRSVDRIVVLSLGMREALLKRGIDGDKLDVIWNWCDEEALKPVEPDATLEKRLRSKDEFVVLFAGTMGVYQSLDSVIEAAQRLFAAGDNVRFVFVGGGIDLPRLKELASNVPSVVFLDRRPTEEMPAIVAAADALLVHLKRDPLFTFTIPSKTQAYLFAGRPILMGVEGDAADILSEAGAGMLFEPENAESLVNAVRSLIQLSPAERATMGARGADFYRDRMSLQQGVDRFEDTFNQTIASYKRA
ncbi:MAG: glycosyltransferase WbuB [Verrucomicrobiaceae bacterium]|nr:MAG: glycosyltransferase WbuB [Verrucomicrobiaceae bacterium]